MNSKYKKKIKVKLFISLILISLIILQLFLLKRLDYSTSSISWISIEDIKNASPPTPNFSVGNIEWDVEKYSKAEELEPFRKYFQDNCLGRKGISAASCVSESLIERIPFGEPSTELFNSNFSPVSNFEQHINGKPGHCVSYSGIASTMLLSVGIPARMLQTLPKEKGGHNIIEVWDENEGWIAFDPLSDTLIQREGKYLSALEAAISDEFVKRVEVNRENLTEGYLVDYYSGENPFNNAIFYPEPWLYTRVGEKNSLIYRGSFAAFGRENFLLGTAQNLLRYGTLICLIILTVLSINLITILRLYKNR